MLGKCGYIYVMKDRERVKDHMLHIRFTDIEQRQIKAHCALKGKSMQEYIRGLVLKDIVKKKGRSIL